MRLDTINGLILHEEKRAIKIYLYSFYITLVLYDFFYFYIYKKYISKVTIGFENPLGYVNYVIFLLLVFVSYYLYRKGKQAFIKYIYVIAYFSFATIYDCIVFLPNPTKYMSGNAAELILVMFSPIFINIRFYWVVTLGAVLRYIIVGAVIQSPIITIPVILVVVLSGIAYIFLIRFSSYIKALTSTYEELRHKEKLAFIGEMATTIGHEIRNPLASLKGFTQLQREKYPEDQYYFSIMDKEVDRINTIVNDLLVLGRPRSAHFTKNNLKNIIEYVVSISQQLANQKNTKIDVWIEEDLPLIECDENQIKQVLINLIKNGIESMPEDGKLKIHVKKADENSVSISVIDHGCGISKEEMTNLFEPFFTTKEDGTGLGLMVTRKIIEDHQGKIEIESEVNQGTKVEVLLPIRQ
ncbi:ATP-binding protein [Fredinandcohnia humi]